MVVASFAVIAGPANPPPQACAGANPPNWCPPPPPPPPDDDPPPPPDDDDPFPPDGGSGGQITVMEALSFQRFAITKNDAVYSYTVGPFGEVSRAPEFVVGAEAVLNGEILLEGLPANQPVTISFTDGALRLLDGPPEPHFLITDFTTDQPIPDPYVADEDGRLTIFYGATMRTTGTGERYRSGTYVGSHSIIVDF